MRAQRGGVPVAAGAVVIVAGVIVGIPTASAQPVVTQIPEVPAPAGSTVFTNDTTIVDTRPQTIDSWSGSDESRSIAVHFTTGTPECHGVQAEVQETADIVAVKLRSGTPPAAVGSACILIALTGTLTVDLEAPLGDRAVVGIT